MVRPLKKVALVVAIAGAASVAAISQMRSASFEDAPKPPQVSKDGDEGHKDARVAISPQQIEAQSISIEKVEPGTIDRHITVTGTITTDAARVVRVPARVTGIVAEMRKRLGAEVKAGEVVSVLDSREIADAKSEYLTAKVQADLQRTILDRQQKLLLLKAIPTGQLEQTRATFQEAELHADLARQKLSALGLDAAEVEAAAKRDESTPNRSTLRRYALRSPIAGRVVERRVDVGMAVGKEGEPAEVYTVADLSTLWIELAVPTSELSSIKEGARVTVSAGNNEPDNGDGRVIFVSPLLNQDTRTARVIAMLPNPDLAWRPGTFVNVEIATQPRSTSLLLPRAAVQRLDGATTVFVRVADGFEARKVGLGIGDDKFWEIKSGLAKGDRVAVGNSFLLKAELGKSDMDGD